MTNLNPFMTRLIRAGWIAPLVGVVLFAGLWEAVVRIFDVRPFVLLAPSEIGAELNATPGFFFENALVTGRHMLIGLVISLIVSIGVGAVMASASFIEEATQPVLVLILVTPWVAYVTRSSKPAASTSPSSPPADPGQRQGLCWVRATCSSSSCWKGRRSRP